MNEILIFARHGATEHNEKGMIQGQSDHPLSNVGKLQAEALAMWVSQQNISRIYSSDLRRAVDTVRIISERLGKEIVTSSLLRERNCGRFEGMSKEQLIAGMAQVRLTLCQL